MAKLFSTIEAAKFLGISIRTLRYWLKSGKLVPKVCKLGRGKGANFALEDLKKVQTSKFKHFKKRDSRRFRKLVGVAMRKEQIQDKVEKITVSIDKLSQVIVKYSKEEYSEVIEYNKTCRIKEGKKRDGTPIKTKYWLRHEDDFADMTPLRWFDLGVVAVCSVYFKRDNLFTVDMILRALIGNDRKKFTDEQKRAVRDSIIRLMKTVITVDMTKTCRLIKKYQTDTPKRTAAILPCELLEDVIINGQKTTAIRMYAQSPLMEIAELKKQLLTIGSKLLAVPNLNNSKRVITVKLFIISFALIMTRNLRNEVDSPNSITLQTIYEVADVAEDSRAVKFNVREVTLKVVEWLKTNEVIKNFELIYKSRKQLHAIKLLI